jgi:hypothetical protein
MPEAEDSESSGGLAACVESLIDDLSQLSAAVEALDDLAMAADEPAESLAAKLPQVFGLLEDVRKYRTASLREHRAVMVKLAKELRAKSKQGTLEHW